VARFCSSHAFLMSQPVNAEMQPLQEVTVSMELFDIKEAVAQVYLRLSFES